MDRIVSNSNGREYVVSSERGDYMLLIDKCEEHHERYVVAYKFDGQSWLKGRYYADFADAERAFNELTK